MTVGGRYRLVEVVGSGTGGRVWRAHDELLNRQVAVKELTWHAGMSVAQRQAAQGRTQQQARDTTGFDDPGLLQVFDVLRTTGTSWVVMEFVRSRSLFDRVSAGGPLGHREALLIGLGVARALETVHAAGVLHRGVEPHHVLIADGGRVVLTDLGVALAAHSAPAAPSGTQPLFGSWNYGAPEVRSGGVATAASDLWSLGATLYTAVEGYPPLFRAGPGIGGLDPPGNPGPLHAVIAGLLVADPAARLTAAATRTALQELAGRAVGVSAVPAPRLPADDVVDTEPAVVPAVAVAAARGRRRLRRVAMVTAALSAAAAAIVATPSIRGFLDVSRSPAATASDLASPVLAGPCAGATPQPVTVAASPPIPVPQGWQWHVDPAGFALPVPGGWTRAALDGAVCFSDPGGSRVFSVDAELLNDDGPLLHWQTAEISALATGNLPGYQRVNMDSLAEGGADWEYTWQPATGPRRHTRQILPTGDSGVSDGLSWTTPDIDWVPAAAEQRTLVTGFRDAANPGPGANGPRVPPVT